MIRTQKREKHFEMLLFLGSSFIEKAFKSKAWVVLRLLVLENELNSSSAQKLIYRVQVEIFIKVY